MSTVKQHLNLAQRALAAGKNVLFVEGKDDISIYPKWLTKIDPLYANKLVLVPTGGRNDLDTALASLGNPGRAYALRDRDERDAPRIVAAQAASPRYLVNVARHCLESYFCDPGEIAAALLAKDTAKYGPLVAAFNTNVSSRLADWVDHWAMWTTAMRLQEDMVSVGYASHFNAVIPLPPDPDIRRRLQSWEDLVDANDIWKLFDALRVTARTKPTFEKYRGCVHGKQFWDGIVLPELLAIENRKDWLIDLADWSAVPPDLDPLLKTALT